MINSISIYSYAHRSWRVWTYSGLSRTVQGIRRTLPRLKTHLCRANTDASQPTPAAAIEEPLKLPMFLPRPALSLMRQIQRHEASHYTNGDVPNFQSYATWVAAEDSDAPPRILERVVEQPRITRHPKLKQIIEHLELAVKSLCKGIALWESSILLDAGPSFGPQLKYIL
jgi:hypothetical protein